MLRFCQSGAQCVIVSRHYEESAGYARELAGEGFKALGLSADTSKLGDIKKMVVDVVGQYGRIDVLVNSAGVNVRKPAIEYSEEEWDYIIGTNLKGGFLLLGSRSASR